MDHVSEDAPLAADSRAGSEQVLVAPTASTGMSNSRALKIAGITTLVCLLLSAQAFTAYMVFAQREQIHGLQSNNQRLQSQMGQRSQVPPQKMVMPIGSLPLLDVFDDDGKSPKPATPKAEPKVQLNQASPSVEEELLDFMKDFKPPRFNQSFLANLQTLKQQLNETSWKSFESWLHYWLLFQTAQKTPTPRPVSQAPKTKCQVEASNGLRRGLVGSFRPKCDEQGNYRPMQCLPSSGHCWCVDQNGVRIEGSMTRGQPDCSSVLRPSTPSSEEME